MVQELTGLTYILDAARLGPPDPARDAELVRSTASRLRQSTGQLRSLLVDIYPPSLTEEGLPASLIELAGGLERAGLAVELDVDGAADVPPRRPPCCSGRRRRCSATSSATAMPST